MKRLFIAALVCFSLPALAFYGSRDSNYNVAISSGSFDPLSLSPVLYYQINRSSLFQSNACTGAAPSADGDPVGCIQDLGSLGLNLTSTANDATRPTYHPNSGKPFITCTSASSQILRNTTTAGLYANGSVSIFVATNSNPAASAILLSEANTGTTNQFAQWFVANSSPISTSVVFVRDNSATTLLFNTLVPNAFTNTSTVYGITWDGTTIKGYLGGSASGTNRSLASGGILTLNDISICGMLRTTSSAFWQGNIQAIIATKSVLSGTQITNLSNYFSALQ